MTFKRLVFNLIHPISFFKKIRLKNIYKKAKTCPPDKYIKKVFKLRVGYSCNLSNPTSYNEKLQWLKLNYRNSLCNKLSDKLLVRSYVEEKIGKQYLIPLFGVWDSPKDIDFSNLPNQFVLKCNHNSGLGMYICKNKKDIDEERVKSNLEIGLSEDYWVKTKEWVYEGIKKKILCEAFLGDNNGLGINDYKFYCFDGEPKYFLVSSNRMKGVRFDYFDLNKKPLPFSQGGERGNINIDDLDISEMIDVSKKLSNGFPHVRVDLYFLEGKVYFGEMTFFDSSGFEPFKPRKWDYINGNYLNLPKK